MKKYFWISKWSCILFLNACVLFIFHGMYVSKYNKTIRFEPWLGQIHYYTLGDMLEKIANDESHERYELRRFQKIVSILRNEGADIRTLALSMEVLTDYNVVNEDEIRIFITEYKDEVGIKAMTKWEWWDLGYISVRL